MGFTKYLQKELKMDSQIFLWDFYGDFLLLLGKGGILRAQHVLPGCTSQFSEHNNEQTRKISAISSL